MLQSARFVYGRLRGHGAMTDWNSWSFAATVAFGVLGCTLAIFFYLKGRRFRQVAWTYFKSPLQTKAHPDVRILFKGEEVPNLTRLLVAFWNVGNEEIKALTHIPKDGNPSILFEKDSTVLSVAVVAQSIDVIKFNVIKEDAHTVRLLFEYLNPEDGGLVEVLYADSPTTGSGVRFVSPIIGGRGASIRSGRRSPWVNERPGMLLLVGVLCAYFFFAVPTVVRRAEFTGNSTAILLSVLVLASLTAWLAVLVVRDRRQARLPRFVREHLRRHAIQ